MKPRIPILIAVAWVLLVGRLLLAQGPATSRPATAPASTPAASQVVSAPLAVGNKIVLNDQTAQATIVGTVLGREGPALKVWIEQVDGVAEWQQEWQKKNNQTTRVKAGGEPLAIYPPMEPESSAKATAEVFSALRAGDKIQAGLCFDEHPRACSVTLNARGQAPIGFNFPSGDARFSGQVWVPDQINPVRGMVICHSMSDYGDSKAAAFSMGMGLISTGGRLWRNGATAADAQAMLDAAAAAAKRPEISNAPIAMMGYSMGGGNTVGLMNLFPERTVAFVPICAYFYGLTVDDRDAPQLRIPGLCLLGSKDVAGQIHGRNFDLWRSLNGQTAVAITWGCGHSMSAPATEIGWFWISEAMRLRFPGGSVSKTPGQPLLLKSINPADGWLGDAVRWDWGPNPTETSKNIAFKPIANVSAFTPIAPASKYAGKAATASWCPSQDAAFVYRAFTSVDSLATAAKRTEPPYQTELCFTAPIMLQVCREGDQVPVTIDARAFAAVKMELFEGSRPIASAAAPSEGRLWRFTFVPAQFGVRALVAIATNAQGEQTSIFRCLCVNPKNPSTMGQDAPK